MMYLKDVLVFKNKKRIDWNLTDENIRNYLIKKYPDYPASALAVSAANMCRNARRRVKRHRINDWWYYVHSTPVEKGEKK